jgi:hypothetical protein
MIELKDIREKMTFLIHDKFDDYFKEVILNFYLFTFFILLCLLINFE